MAEARDTWRSGNARPSPEGRVPAFRPSAMRAAPGANTRPGPGNGVPAEKREGEAKAEQPAEGELSPEEKQRQAEERERAARQREEKEKQRRSEELKKGLHPLQDCYVFWFSKRASGPAAQRTAYEDTIKKITEFSTVEGFWCMYCHLLKANSLPNYTDYHLFKKSIRPLWEDDRNRAGGKWILRFNKKLSGRYWEELVLALIGDQIDYGDSVCGAVLSLRSGEDIISVWNRDASDSQATMLLRESIKKHLQLPPSYLMEYKPHDASLKDHSSFRNTWLRG
eukprot:TRINITY_DN6505_c0_g1_i1.p1 TRINITY_DN6505_c0_g1~~TRINITY_DN6505_c0_g1_i1.p1  ORF type:complete len:281 (-),score=58.73 TRINITY_DN6505_c0_g1_i1:262-1104(-)